MKRLFDIISSLFALTIFCIPMLMIGLLIKINSKGPILFRQVRIGMNGTNFKIYKFRTMRIDTPNVSTEALGDPSRYVTKIGGGLRKTSLDELPQFFNILRGDMSIVGPRPALYNQYNLITMRDNYGINGIRPGLTGYAQIMGRDLISDVKKVEYDYYYVINQGLLLDMKIISFTFFIFLKQMVKNVVHELIIR